MLIRPFYLSCLAHASYLLADERTKTAVVVDPQRDVDAYLEEARKLGVDIRHVMLTHFHADFVAGHLELRDRRGANIYLGAKAEADYAFTPLADGMRLEWGSLGIGVLETPGHTPEGVTLLVYDLDADRENPKAALTGDTLFIGDVGRPDLMASVGFTAAQLGGMLYQSLTTKLMTLPDSTLVYPAHGAGSMCGKALSSERVSTIGEQKKYNYALKARDREEFLRLVTADQTEAPAYFAHDADMNRRERATLDANLSAALKALTPADAEDLARSGALLLDVRDPSDYSGAHWRGAMNIGLDGKFATWAGSLLERTRPVVLVTDPGREREAVTRLARVGFDRVAGVLAGGMGSLAARPDLVEETPRTTARALAKRLGADAPLVVDVRTDAERADGFVPGSLHLPLSQWPRRMSEIPEGRPVAVYCAGGYRSAIAASLLRAAGRRNVTDVVGGFAAWRKEGLPESRP
ncbi:MAG: MBL fold metallo-hydrolase [Elusimicrobia bacterium]|nr:MBL fold metallo-hydrolase [Elusimicrobiota bacterium]